MAKVASDNLFSDYSIVEWRMQQRIIQQIDIGGTCFAHPV
jgi:hypothetical protein